MRIQKIAICLIAFFAANPQVEAAQSDFELGVAQYKKGDYTNAALSLDKALKANQTDPAIWYYDALCYHQLKNWALATSRYKTLAKYYPNTPAGKLAIAFLKKHDPSFVETVAATPVTASTPLKKSDNAAASTSEKLPTDESSNEEDELEKELAKLPDKAHFYFKKGPSGHMEVDLLVNGHPVKAEFDTGASAFFYSDSLSESGVDLNKSKQGRMARGWAGKSVFTKTMPAEVKLGSMTRKIDITIASNSGDLGHNLIGQDFIKGYQYEIDDKGGRVDLKKILELKAKDVNPLYDIPLTVKGTKDYIPIQINGKKVNAFIDTGSFATILSAGQAKLLGLTFSGESQKLMGVGGSVTMDKAYVDIQIGGLRQSNFPVLIGGSGGCAIGQDLMNGWRYKVDRKNKLLRFFH
ncbi:aspartyl protease family protein [bacterium]|nr:aspartyl protease family protein [bacterium]